MRRFVFPLIVIGLGIFGLVHQDAITDVLTTMYPQDPARQTALQHCFFENRYFNRSSAKERTDCYAKYLAASEARP
jgi:hypothetical protein